MPNFYYYSYSQNPDQINANEAIISDRFDIKEYLGYSAKYKENYSFRIVWCFKDPIDPKTHLEIYETLVSYVFKDFQGVDTSTRNPQQLFFGGNSYAVVVNPEETSLATLGWGKVLEAYNAGILNKNVHKQKTAAAPDWEEIEVPEAIVVGSKWMDWLRTYCSLLDKWMRQEYLDYNQRLTLWSNLRFLKRKSYSDSIVKDLMKYYRPEVWQGHTFNENEIKGKFRDSKLKPAKIVKYAGEYLTVPEFFERYNNSAKKIDNNDNLRIEELEGWVNNNLEGVINMTGLDYFQAQTGVGKTEKIIDFFIKNKFQIGKVIYSVPTHILAKEFEERLLAKDPDFPIYRIPEREYSALDLTRLRLGLRAITKSVDIYRNEKFKALFDYDTFGVFVITHSLLVNIGDKIPSSLIIVDENIEQALVKEVKITLPQLGSLMPYLPKNRLEDLQDFIDEVNEAETGDAVSDKLKDLLSVMNLNAYLNDVNEDTCIDGLFLAQNAISFRKSTKNKKLCVRALIKSEMITSAMEREVPVKLFTATPLSQRLKNYYGAVFGVVEAPYAGNQGKIIQFAGITGARGNANGKGMDDKHFQEAVRYIKAKLTPEQIANSHIINFLGSSDR